MIRNAMRIVAIFCLLGISGWAQTVPPACPVLNVAGPSGIIPEGQVARYTARVDTRGQNLNLTYTWSLSSGEIKAGQGTGAIAILQPPNCVTVTVEVGGLPDGCPVTFSETACGCPAPEAEKLDEIHGALTKEKLARIRDAVAKYDDDQYVQFWLIVAGTNERTQRKKLDALTHLFRGTPERATYVLSDKTDDKLIVWAVPSGATPPEP